MTRNRGLPQYKIIEVSKDSIGRYAKIKAKYPDGEIIIRWALDSLTFGNLKSAFSTSLFDKMPNLAYAYQLLNFYGSSRNPDGTKDFFGYIECVLGQQTKQIEFKSSETFAGNIEWMSKVKSFEELKDLKWND